MNLQFELRIFVITVYVTLQIIKYELQRVDSFCIITRSLMYDFTRRYEFTVGSKNFRITSQFKM